MAIREEPVYIVLRHSEDSQTSKFAAMSVYYNYKEALDAMRTMLYGETKDLSNTANITDWHVYSQGYDWSDGCETVRVRYEILRSFVQ